MKKLAFITLVLTICIQVKSVAQFSVGTGISLPIGDYADDDGGSAGVGFLVKGGWDKLLNDNIGIATGITIGGNPLNEDISGLDASSWSYFILEVGVLIQATEEFKLRGMIVRAGASSPELKQGSQVVLTSATSGSFGFDIGTSYEIGQFYIGANYTSFNPEFQYDFRNIGAGIVEEKQSMGMITLTGGYIF